MQNLLRDMSLSQAYKAQIIEMIKQKGEILIKGYLKHENIRAAEEMKLVLASL